MWQHTHVGTWAAPGGREAWTVPPDHTDPYRKFPFNQLDEVQGTVDHLVKCLETLADDVRLCQGRLDRLQEQHEYTVETQRQTWRDLAELRNGLRAQEALGSHAWQQDIRIDVVKARVLELENELRGCRMSCGDRTDASVDDATQQDSGSGVGGGAVFTGVSSVHQATMAAHRRAVAAAANSCDSSACQGVKQEKEKKQEKEEEEADFGGDSGHEREEEQKKNKMKKHRKKKEGAAGADITLTAKVAVSSDLDQREGGDGDGAAGSQKHARAADGPLAEADRRCSGQWRPGRPGVWNASINMKSGHWDHAAAAAGSEWDTRSWTDTNSDSGEHGDSLVESDRPKDEDVQPETQQVRCESADLQRIFQKGDEQMVLALFMDMPTRELNARDDMRRTVLHHAAGLGMLEAVRWLVDHADDGMVNSKDRDGWTALHWASWQGHVGVCNVLLNCKRFREVETRDHLHSSTALHCAARYGRAGASRALLDHPRFGLDGVEARDADTYTALHLAAINGHAEVCRSLVEHPRYCVEKAEDSNGMIARDLAIGSAQREFIVLDLAAAGRSFALGPGAREPQVP